jgi:hypothetical protein
VSGGVRCQMKMSGCCSCRAIRHSLATPFASLAGAIASHSSTALQLPVRPLQPLPKPNVHGSMATFPTADERLRLLLFNACLSLAMLLQKTPRCLSVRGMCCSAGIDVRDALRGHFRRYFGAQNLRIVILGSSPLPRLSVLLERHFGGMPRALDDAPDYSTMGFPFEGAVAATFVRASAHPTVTGNQCCEAWRGPRLFMGRLPRKLSQQMMSI